MIDYEGSFFPQPPSARTVARQLCVDAGNKKASLAPVCEKHINGGNDLLALCFRLSIAGPSDLQPRRPRDAVNIL